VTAHPAALVLDDHQPRYVTAATPPTAMVRCCCDVTVQWCGRGGGEDGVSEDLDPPPGRGAVMWGLRMADGRILACMDGEEAVRSRAVWWELGENVDVVTCRALDETGEACTPWHAAGPLKVTS
jgi:hypothetical protein